MEEKIDKILKLLEDVPMKEVTEILEILKKIHAYYYHIYGDIEPIPLDPDQTVEGQEAPTQ